MTIFNIVTLLGGLALFLYGMNVMGDGLKKLSGGKLETILQKLTSSPLKGVALGLAVTAVIQSSSATTVMVVGFVNSGIMELTQAVGVIMGANIGTTVTSWLLSMTGIQGESLLMQLLKPSSFSPVLAFIGIILIMFCKKEKKNDLGTIFLGFAILMSGMMSMSASVEPLADVPEFANLMTMFSNPILGLLAGTILTAIIQSSSASVGILQALCATGTIKYSVALPVIMGQNIGTCITAILSAVGANRNSKRTALIHLFFNVIGTTVFMVAFYASNVFVDYAFLDQAANETGIAIIHSCFNVAATILLLPFNKVLVKLAYVALPLKEDEKKEVSHRMELLDKRFLEKPAFAVAQSQEVSRSIMEEMFEFAEYTYELIYNYNSDKFEKIKEKYENIEMEIDYFNEYLVDLSYCILANKDHYAVSFLLQITGEMKGITTQMFQVAKAGKKLNKKNRSFSDMAKEELEEIWKGIMEVLKHTSDFVENESLSKFDNPYEKVLALKRSLKKSKKNHMKRLQMGTCTSDAGMAFLDVLSGYEQTLFYCTNMWEVVKEK
ncbi:MAG: Na/Pi cotransporter family protein [Lachnospiraceae bacterium]|nr:Na/Pi cotransporter family protein [Lachnospiraceae bacterium]